MIPFFPMACSVFVLAAAFIGCSEDSSTSSNQNNSISVVDNAEELSECDGEHNGEMVYISDSSTVYFCADGQWNPLNGKDGLDGKDGSDGRDGKDGVDGKTDTIVRVDSVIEIDTIVELDSVIKFDTIVRLDSVVKIDTVYRVDSVYVIPKADSQSLNIFNPTLLYDTLVDGRDNHVYKTIKIADQIWMAENLNFSDSVQYASMLGGSWCLNNSLDSCEKYGRLYSWLAAIDKDKTGCKYTTTSNNCSITDSAKIQGICPSGWRLPAIKDFSKLGTNVKNLTAGLKSVVGWASYRDVSAPTNEYGFSALPVGRYSSANFGPTMYDAWFWTATNRSQGDYRARAYQIRYDSREITSSDEIIQNIGLSVRCIKE